jgi:DNA-binding IclR family transcriptional regulator
MPLPPRQIMVLRYLGDGNRKNATTGNVAKDLRINRTATRNALRLLAGKGLIAVDRSTFPMSYAITEIGGAVLAAAPLDPS